MFERLASFKMMNFEANDMRRGSPVKRQWGLIATAVFTIYYNLVTHYRSNKEIHEVSSDLQHLRDELSSKIKIHEEVNRIIERELTTLANETNRLHQYNTDLLHFVVICNKMTQINAHLMAIQRMQLESNKVDLYALSAITGLEFPSAKSRDTSWRTWKPDHWTVVMEFDVVFPSRDSMVVYNEPFEIWRGLAGSPRKEKLESREYIYNSTSDCVKALSETRERMVYEQCLLPRYRDKHIKKFTVVDSASTLADIRPETQVKVDGNNVYVYCFGGSVTVGLQTVRCPIWPFKLPKLTHFNTSDEYSWSPALMVYNSSLHTWFPLDIDNDDSSNNITLEFLLELKKVREREKELTASGRYLPGPRHFEIAMFFLFLFVAVCIGSAVVYLAFRRSWLTLPVTRLEQLELQDRSNLNLTRLPGRGE